MNSATKSKGIVKAGIFLATATSICAALLFLLEPNAEAQAAPKANVEKIKSSIMESLGASGVTVLSVEPLSQIDGMYEVIVTHGGTKKIIYSNGSGSHIILGDLMESKTMNNITEAKLDKLNAINFDKDLPVGLALKNVYGNGSRKIAVFEDPNCGYCKRFRKETLARLQDATVYTYVYPVLGKDSQDKVQKVLCASNKEKMWDDWMLNNESPSGKGDCNSPMNDIIKVGRTLGVTGTPTIFFQDGTRASGAIPGSELNRRLELAANKK